MTTARSKPPVPPNTSLLFGHNATALLPHRASIRRNIRLRIERWPFPDRLLVGRTNALVTSQISEKRTSMCGHKATGGNPLSRRAKRSAQESRNRKNDERAAAPIETTQAPSVRFVVTRRTSGPQFVGETRPKQQERWTSLPELTGTTKVVRHL